jgi:hypothetical protein
LAISCKPPIDNDGQLLFSYFDEDEEGKDIYVIDNKITVVFDTVFTSIGSVTRHFVVHNTSKEDIKTTIFLAGGNQSFYSINVNGLGINENGERETFFKDVEIPKKDSIFIFVKVNIDPKNQNNPFLVTDSIVFITGKREQDVKLLAYGQDAHYILADKSIKTIDGIEMLRYKIVAGEHETVTWTKDRPYVVYGMAAIDSLGELIIEPGSRIYFHKNSGLWASPYSTLKVEGTIAEPVLFRGDRLESQFDRDYAQWDRIWINEGTTVTIENAIITNAFVGVQVEPSPFGSMITVAPNVASIKNTIIKNTQQFGVLSRFLNIDMTNCVIMNNGQSSLQLEGGEYMMKHLTVANYFTQKERKAAACYVSNLVSLYEDYPWETKAEFINCIIYGKNKTEVDVKKGKDAELEALFQNCLIKAKDNSYFMDCLLNKDPQFVDTLAHDFQLLPASPAIGAGKPNIEVDEDILGKPRGDKPDIGAYQFGR